MKQLLAQVHSPTLDTILMVEETIKNAKQVVSLAEIKRALPKQVNHNTLKTIISYLQLSGKIGVTPYGVVWIYAPREELEKLMARGREWNGKTFTKSSATQKKY